MIFTLAIIILLQILLLAGVSKLNRTVIALAETMYILFAKVGELDNVKSKRR